jgi:Cu-Zn family superoxide dismutase
MSKTRRNKQQLQCVAVFQMETVKGDVLFTQRSGNSVEITAEFTALPSGKHGFHIHKAGDLRGQGCKGACAHYHVGPPSTHGDEPGKKGPRHTGDLGNIEMPHKGPFRKTWILKGTTVKDLLGRSVIVHADEDDVGLGGHEDSKTTGHSGARIACAIIGRVMTYC